MRRSQLDFLDNATVALDEIDRRARLVFDSLDVTDFNRKPSKKRWSAGQCFEHLIKINERYLRLLADAFDQAAKTKQMRHGPLKHTLFERHFIWILEPPARLKLPAPPSVSAKSVRLDPMLVRARYFEGHDELRGLIEYARDIDIKQTKVSSPFGSWLRWSVAATFDIMMAHERRHLLQASRI